MTHRERFNNIYNFRPVDRIPVYFFGTWRETKQRWIKEGYKGNVDLNLDKGPQLDDMDPDWETGLWDNHGLAITEAIGDIEPCILQEDENRRMVRNSLGEEYIERKDGSSFNHTVVYPMEPTRESWNRIKRFYDPYDSRRYCKELALKASALNAKDAVTTFMGGSLYGWLRSLLGIENVSYLMYDVPELYEEIIDHFANLFMTVMKPVLNVVKFDFVYFFEDCCSSTGPLFSPAFYKEILDKYYKKLIRFYKDNHVPLALIDSDGVSEPLIPCWLESGFDIIFPIEVGKWRASPVKLREKHGKLCMLGGVDKHLIYGSEDKLREHLLSLRPSVSEGGYIPIPDHRIPPEVSLAQMHRYVKIFNEVFNG